MKPSLSIVTTAYNEEGDLETSVKTVLDCLDNRFSSSEILIINDGSRDSTGTIADQLAAKHPEIRVIHHPQNQGLGHTLREGYALAAKDYVIWVAGDNGCVGESLIDLFGYVGKADMVIPYMVNPEVRDFFRRNLSRLFTLFINFLFGLNLRYYNGSVIYRTELVRSLPTFSQGFFLMAETVIRLLKKGHSYIEVPAYQRARTHGSSKALYPRNVLSVLGSIWKLFWEIRLNR